MKSFAPFRSLSGKLVLLFLAMAMLLAMLAGGGIGAAFRVHFKENIRPHMHHYMEYVRNDIGFPPDPRRAERLAERVPVEIYIRGPGVDWASDGEPVDLHRLRPHRSFFRRGIHYTLGELDGREYLVSREGGYAIAFSVRHIREQAIWRGIIGIGVLLLLLVALYYATRRLISPIHSIGDGVRKFGSGDLTHRIEIDRKDELGELATSINTMADDIQQMLEAKRQLLLAISHELRSPLTRAKVAIDMLEDADTRREVNRDLDEMEKLIEELLETERLSSRHHALNREEVSLTDLAQHLITDRFANQGIHLQIPEEPLPAPVDTPRLRLLLKNLLQNALQHTPEDAEPPQLLLRQAENKILIQVRDFGTGIEKRHLPHLTEPFYRVDPARQRQTGGYGLGLYLCRMIAEAHGGTLTIESAPGEGTVVTIELPAAGGE
jgi:signal transduction histidine kinase